MAITSLQRILVIFDIRLLGQEFSNPPKSIHQVPFLKCSVKIVTFILEIEDLRSALVPAIDKSMRFIQVQIGFDPDENKIFTLTVQLDVPGGLFGDELSFWVEAEDADGKIETYWDGLETRFISRFYRSQILAVIANSTEVLLNEFEPKSVIMVASSANLPIRATAKYLKIIEVFKKLGYDNQELGRVAGVQSWRFDR